MQITARGADLEKCSMAPGSGQLPADYVFAPGSEEPGMGGHWVDPGAHEFHGQAFTHTFIYGTYDGAVIFYEPMITLDYLRAQPSETVPVKLPEVWASAGYYPTGYRVHYDESRREYTVALEGLTRREALAAR